MKVVLLTGITGGLGCRIAEVLLRDDDYHLVGISRTEGQAVQRFAEQYPDRFTHLVFDMARPESIKLLYLEKIRKIGPVYGLVNNAAAAYDDLATNMSLEPLMQMYATNVLSPMLLTKYAIRDMLLHHTRGSIVHVSSVSAHTGYKGLSMYASTKGALEAFSKGIAREWGPVGIRSNCVVPGFMRTAMSEKLGSELMQKIFRRTALKEETNPVSVAQTVAFLLSEASSSITGAAIPVDSGTI